MKARLRPDITAFIDSCFSFAAKNIKDANKYAKLTAGAVIVRWLLTNGHEDKAYKYWREVLKDAGKT